MISPEGSCLAPGVYEAFAITEAVLYRMEVPKCKLYPLFQFQDWISRQNGTSDIDGSGSKVESDSPQLGSVSRRFTYEDPSFFDESEVSFTINAAVRQITDNLVQTTPMQRFDATHLERKASACNIGSCEWLAWGTVS